MAQVEFPDKLQFLFEPSRWKVLHGGRGGAKSWGIARALLLLAVQKPLRILCVREYQSSLAESVHKLLELQIDAMGLRDKYTVEKASIRSSIGSEFFFEGIARNTQKIKSYEATDICWVEEASMVSHDSWMILEPTIRKAGSEIWVSFNPNLKSDATYKKFIETSPPDAVVVEINWRDNPWFPLDVLGPAMEKMRQESPDEYLHVYEGHTKTSLYGAVYGAEIRKAMLEQRVTFVPWERAQPIDTFWDLGRRDKMAIWFAQKVNFQVRVVDYYENSLKDLDHYFKVLQARPYVYGTHHLPHDARAKVLGRKNTIEEQVRGVLGRVRIVPKQSVTDGIAAARKIFPDCWFDAKRTAKGLDMLKGYHYDVDSDDNVISDSPVHDETSHGADAWRYLAIAMGAAPATTSEKITAALREARVPFRAVLGLMPSPQAWMG